MAKVFLISQDPKVASDTSSIVALLKNWELHCFQDLESAWISYFEELPKLCIVDLDMFTEYKTDRSGQRASVSPLFIFVSSRPVHEEPNSRYIFAIKTIEYIVKPINPDVLVRALGIASKP